MSCDYPISQNLLFSHSKVGGLMDHKAVDFDERAGVDKSVDSLSRGHLSSRMLRFYLLGSAAELSLFSFLLQLIEPLSHTHWFDECGVGSLYKSRAGSSRRESLAILHSLCEFGDHQSRLSDYHLQQLLC